MFVVTIVIVIIICWVIILAALTVKVVKYCKKGNVIMSFKEALELAELPVITFYNGENKFNLLLDTGSSRCVINESSLKNYNYDKVEGTGNINGIDGIIRKTTFINMKFNYRDRLYSTSFQVVDMDKAFDVVKKETGVTIHGILGSKFFEKYKYVLDYNDMIAYSNKYEKEKKWFI